jgi:hypothetical protein
VHKAKRAFVLTASFIIIIISLVPIGSLGGFAIQAQDQDPVIQYFLPYFGQYSQPTTTQPLTTTSYYITTTDTAYMYELGCSLGTRDKTTPGSQDNVVVLDYSYPICFSDGSYGAEFFGAGPASLQHVSLSAIYFATGYYNCSGTDNESNLVIGVGTNNKPFSCNTTAKAEAHGAAWSGLVSQVNQWLLDQGMFHQVQAYGANDMELGWNNPTWTRAWIAGFESNDENFYLHFGDASGCPYEEKPWYNCGTSAYPEWELEDVWYVSWGAPSALPLPLIYLTSGVHAKQWAYLSQYSVAQHGYPMHFTGVFTQSGACQQYSGACSNTDNTPEQAYDQLLFELSKYPATAQSLRWKTDIRWILANEVNSTLAASGEPAGSIGLSAILEKISILESALQEQALRPDARTLIEEKLSRYESLANKIESSRGNPAPKLFD